MSEPVRGVNYEVGTSKAAARIRAAAIKVFAAKGYGATSTREIAASVNLSPGAVYPHYKTKESLLFAISLEGHLAALDATTDADSPTAPPVDRLTATVGAYVKWHAHHHTLARSCNTNCDHCRTSTSRQS